MFAEALTPERTEPAAWPTLHGSAQVTRLPLHLLAQALADTWLDSAPAPWTGNVIQISLTNSQAVRQVRPIMS